MSSFLSETYNPSEDEICEVVKRAQSVSQFKQLLLEVSGSDCKIYGKEVERIVSRIDFIISEYPETSFDEIPNEYTDVIPHVPKFKMLWNSHIRNTGEDDIIEA